MEEKESLKEKTKKNNELKMREVKYTKKKRAKKKVIKQVTKLERQGQVVAHCISIRSGS